MEINGRTAGKQAFPMVFRAPESQPTLGRGRDSPEEEGQSTARDVDMGGTKWTFKNRL